MSGNLEHKVRSFDGKDIATTTMGAAIGYLAYGTLLSTGTGAAAGYIGGRALGYIFK